METNTSFYAVIYILWYLWAGRKCQNFYQLGIATEYDINKDTEICVWVVDIAVSFINSE